MVALANEMKHTVFFNQLLACLNSLYVLTVKLYLCVKTDLDEVNRLIINSVPGLMFLLRVLSCLYLDLLLM